MVNLSKTDFLQAGFIKGVGFMQTSMETHYGLVLEVINSSQKKNLDLAPDHTRRGAGIFQSTLLCKPSC